MCKSHTKKIGALKLSQQDVGKNCIFRGCEQIETDKRGRRILQVKVDRVDFVPTLGKNKRFFEVDQLPLNLSRFVSP